MCRMRERRSILDGGRHGEGQQRHVRHCLPHDTFALSRSDFAMYVLVVSTPEGKQLWARHRRIYALAEGTIWEGGNGGVYNRARRGVGTLFHVASARSGEVARLYCCEL